MADGCFFQNSCKLRRRWNLVCK